MNKRTYFIAKVCSFFSGYVDGIVSCTEVGKINHLNFGYHNKCFLVIPNGFDLEQFNPDSGFGIKETELLRLLNISRWEPLKDHNTLLAAANILKTNGIKFELLLVGKNIDYKNKVLINLISYYGLENEVKLLGVRKDIPDIMYSSDIYVSSSISEGFPNVIGEAMSSELYCVATNAGDTELIIGGLGTVVPVCSPEKLADGIQKALNIDKTKLMEIKTQARKRIEEEFSIQRIVKEYETMYKKIYQIG